MKLRNNWLLIYLMLSLSVSGQTFLKHFAIDSVGTQSFSLSLADSFIFVAGVCADTSVPNGIKSYLAKFDYSGNYISRAEIRPSEFVQFACPNKNSMIRTNDGGFAIAGYAQDSLDSTHIALVKYNRSGQLQFYKTYQIYAPYLYANAFCLLQGKDKQYYVLGDIQFANYQTSIFFIKLDSNFTVEKSKIFSNLSQNYSLSGNACFLSDSDILISNGRTDNNINYWQSIQTTCFLKVDTSGNLTSSYCTSDRNTKAYYNVAATSDSGYLSSGSYFQTRIEGDGLLDEKYLVKWDRDFNLIWGLKTGAVESDNSFSDFVQTQNNSIVLCGQNVADTGIAAGFRGVIAQVSMAGNLNWLREYSVPLPNGSDANGSQNYLYDVELMPNGDIVAVGSWQTSSINSPLYFQQVGWIIRVDSNGCMDNGNCGLETKVQNIPEAEPGLHDIVKIFPNPSKGIFIVSVQVDIPVGCTIEVYDALGCQLLAQPIFNHSNLVNLHHFPTGTYFYKVSNVGVVVSEGKLVIQK